MAYSQVKLQYALIVGGRWKSISIFLHGVVVDVIFVVGVLVLALCFIFLALVVWDVE